MICFTGQSCVDKFVRQLTHSTEDQNWSKSKNTEIQQLERKWFDCI